MVIRVVHLLLEAWAITTLQILFVVKKVPDSHAVLVHQMVLKAARLVLALTTIIVLISRCVKLSRSVQRQKQTHVFGTRSHLNAGHENPLIGFEFLRSP